MKRIAIACIVAVLLCAGCKESSRNTKDEKYDTTSYSEDSREIIPQADVTENSTTENTVTQKFPSKAMENTSEPICTAVSTNELSNGKEFVITEKFEEQTETTTTANDNIQQNTTTLTIADTTLEFEKNIAYETKSDIIELPFVPVG